MQVSKGVTEFECIVVFVLSLLAGYVFASGLTSLFTVVPKFLPFFFKFKL